MEQERHKNSGWPLARVCMGCLHWQLVPDEIHAGMLIGECTNPEQNNGAKFKTVALDKCPLFNAKPDYPA